MAATCSTCGDEVREGTRFCGSCGASVELSDVDATLDAPAGGGRVTPPGHAAASTPASSGAGSGSGSELGSGLGAFTSGAIFAGRYRVIGLLGRGGMGEVYRADDLQLDQSVAIKRLPDELARNPERLLRFRQEVRLARQISHPNVCRVYDIGEADGVHYLTMEYIDGEDLRSLLRRIGRLPSQKATEMARQICAGIAASHEKGVLHRDLKPANIMLDGDGKVRITDFGLAALSDNIAKHEIRAGTPAYMAPEQLAGESVTAQSDIYSLGLVLYDIYTGEQTFKGSTVAEFSRLHAESLPENPTVFVEGLSPAVERVILRCLEKDPTDRPSSALAVAAALPGGDPLAAALAAGEIPSPEMVAAAGSTEEVSRRYLWLLAPLAVALIATAWLTDRWSWEAYAPMEKPPAVLLDHVQEMVGEFGYETVPKDEAWWITSDLEFSNWIAERDSTAGRWERLRREGSPGTEFAYRSSPREMETFQPNGRVNWTSPPFEVSGMTRVRTDMNGLLRRFEHMPPERDDADSSHHPMPDYAPLFAAAGFGDAKFSSVSPEWTPDVFCDQRVAWEGSWAGIDSIRIEAGSYRGRPVSWKTIWPWTKPTRMTDTTGTAPTGGFDVVGLITLGFFLIVMLGSVLLARLNIMQGRGDRRGATRVAGVIYAAMMVQWVLTGHLVLSTRMLSMFFIASGVALVSAAMVWLFYIALEPYLRRYAPDLLISWVRVLKGRFGDPRVARDTLIGMTASLCMSAGMLGVYVASPLLGSPRPAPLRGDPMFLSSPLHAVSTLVQGIVQAPTSSLVNVLIFILILMAIRRMRPAVIVMTIIVIAIGFMQISTVLAQPAIAFFVAVVVGSLMMVLMVRYGIWAFTAFAFFNITGANSYLSFDFSSWYAPSVIVLWAFTLGVVAWSVRSLTASRR